MKFRKTIGKNAAAIIFSASPERRSFDETHRFKQNKNFFYLTGFNQPNSALVILPEDISVDFPYMNRKKKVSEILFTQGSDDFAERWEGKRTSFEQVNKDVGVEAGMPIYLLDKFISTNLRTYRYLYTNIDQLINLRSEMREVMLGFVDKLRLHSVSHIFCDVNFIIGTMRKVKHEFEVNQIKRAIDITSKGFSGLLKIIKPGMMEYQVQAELEKIYRSYGATDIAYSTIVASGNNACYLHYDTNGDKISAGDLMVIDSGAEFNMYNADVTRTFPVSGRFNKAQRFIYDVVLTANKECISRARAGINFRELSAFSESLIANKLFRAGVIKKNNSIKRYTMHSLGHGLGLDVHDAVPHVKYSDVDYDKLIAGEVITIEPGLYFMKNDQTVPKQFRGIGVRIEDDILITKSGCVNLTAGIVKEPDEIEKLMAG
ncbi:MAG: Xaa-Pro aminopeptidase [Chlorobi bacterium OLB4]|jgi:Xaa-Pro aminopeptidase|nr:MAG: Xaa-Pro aminopeptidase [Chlorobi bacterium OLB4]MBW7855300.1 aminopeptidase P N-terminal domain-containing protein [Ignavibacteria bacterium]